MNFTIADDVHVLVDAVGDVLDRHPVGSAPGIDDGRWRDLTDLGLDALMLPEPDGLNFGLLDATVFAERLGRVALPEPIVSSIVLALARHRHADALDDIGSCVFEPFAPVVVSADGLLSGTVPTPMDEAVDNLVLLAADGAALAVIETADLRAAAASLPTDVLRPSVNVDLDDRPCHDLYRIGVADGHRLRSETAVLTCAELVGGMTEVVADTVRFVSDRRQFGRSVGSFQAIKHQLADMYTATEQARAAVQFAAITVSAEVGSAVGDVAAISRWVPRAAVDLFETAIHLHGAMGFSWDVPVHLHLRRALAVRGRFGAASVPR